MVQCLHHSTLGMLQKLARQSRIPVPPALRYDKYRLARCLLQRWMDPATREALVTCVVRIDYPRLARFRNRPGLKPMREVMVESSLTQSWQARITPLGAHRSPASHSE